MKNQFSATVLKNYDSEWLLDEKEKRNIKFAYLAIPDYFKDEETKEIDEDRLIYEIRSTNPQIIIMVIYYSQILDLKFLLEERGILAEIRMNRDLNILSRGQILTMNDVQKDFIQTLSQEDNVEKDVIITGPVGSGKTLLGLEAINIKVSYYKRKYNLNASESQNKLRVVILIGNSEYDSMLKEQITNEISKSAHVSFLNILSQDYLAQFSVHHKPGSYLHTVVMIDEIWR